MHQRNKILAVRYDVSPSNGIKTDTAFLKMYSLSKDYTTFILSMSVYIGKRQKKILQTAVALSTTALRF